MSFVYRGREYGKGDEIEFLMQLDPKTMTFVGRTDDGVVILAPRGHPLIADAIVAGWKVIRVKGKVTKVRVSEGRRRGNYIVVMPEEVEEARE